MSPLRELTQKWWFWAIIIVAFVLGFALTGCGAPASTKVGGTEGTYEVIWVDINNTKVPCVVWDGYKAGGISCDWSKPAVGGLG